MLEHGQLQLLIKPCNQHMFNWMKPVGLLIKRLSNQSYNGWPSAGDVTNEEHQPKPPKPAVLQWLMRYLTTKSWLSWLAENRWKPWFWVGFEASWSSFNMVFVQSWMDYWSVMSKKKTPMRINNNQTLHLTNLVNQYKSFCTVQWVSQGMWYPFGPKSLGYQRKLGPIGAWSRKPESWSNQENTNFFGIHSSSSSSSSPSSSSSSIIIIIIKISIIIIHHPSSSSWSLFL